MAHGTLPAISRRGRRSRGRGRTRGKGHLTASSVARRQPEDILEEYNLLVELQLRLQQALLHPVSVGQQDEGTHREEANTCQGYKWPSRASSIQVSGGKQVVSGGNGPEGETTPGAAIAAQAGAKGPMVFAARAILKPSQDSEALVKTDTSFLGSADHDKATTSKCALTGGAHNSAEAEAGLAASVDGSKTFDQQLDSAGHEQEVPMRAAKHEPEIPLLSQGGGFDVRPRKHWVRPVLSNYAPDWHEGNARWQQASGGVEMHESQAGARAWAHSIASCPTDMRGGGGRARSPAQDILPGGGLGRGEAWKWNAPLALQERERGCHSKGQRWTSVCRGWESLERQFDGFGVRASQLAHADWTATWWADTFSSSTTLSSNQGQGVQKVLDVRFHPSGAPQLVAGCNVAPNELLLYDLEKGTAQELAGHNCQIQAVEYSEGGVSLVSCAGNSLKVWDTKSGSCRYTLGRQVGNDLAAGHSSKVTAMAVNAWEPSLVASSGGPGDCRILLWNVASGNLLTDLSPSGCAPGEPPLPMDALKFANESMLVGGSDTPPGRTAVVQLWDIQTESAMRSFPAHDQYVTSLDVSGDGHIILTGSGDGTVGLFDERLCGAIAHLPLKPNCEITSVGFSSCGTYFQASCSANCTAVWDARMLGAAHGASSPRSLSRMEKLRLSALHSLSHGPPASSVSGVDDGDQGINDARWMHHSPCLVTVSGDGSLAIWDVTLGKPCVRHLFAHSSCINTVAIGVYDDVICTGGDDEKIVLYGNPRGGPRTPWRLTTPLHF